MSYQNIFVASRILLTLSLVVFAQPQAMAITGSLNADGTAVDTSAFPGAGIGFDRLSGVAYLSSTSSACSGVAIATNAILTAAHCLSSAASASFFSYDSNAVFRRAYSYRITNFYTAPGYDINRLGSVQLGDVGVAILDRSIDPSIQRYAIWSNPNLTSVLGHGATFAGYGLTSTGASVNGTARYTSRLETFLNGSGRVESVHQLHTGFNRIEGRDPVFGTAFFTDFDGNGRNFAGDNGYGALEVGTAPGDSGSGVFLDPYTSYTLECFRNGVQTCRYPSKMLSDVPIVVGVTSFSRAAETCPQMDPACMNRFGSQDGYTFVGAYFSWINMILGGGLSSVDSVPGSAAQDGLYLTSLDSFVVTGPGEISPVPEPRVFSIFVLGVIFLRCRKFSVLTCILLETRRSQAALSGLRGRYQEVPIR